MQRLHEIALDLCANLAAEDRYRRLVAKVRSVVPCDSTALLRLTDGVLVPLAVDGLLPEVMGRRFLPAEHPRLQRILQSEEPVRFLDNDLPDPFDGLLVGCKDALSRVHACMGARMVVEGAVVGLLAVDALDPRAFDGLDMGMVATLTALAGAVTRTAGLIERLEQLLEQSTALNQHLLEDAAQRSGDFLGQSEAARRLREEVSLLAGSDLTVLIQGETGVGKEVVARLVQGQSRRRAQPLVCVNCAALPESIAESELFGHVRGAFTSATDKRAGKFEAAHGGTLFLDEIGELPLAIQPKLLRVLQCGDIQRVGADRTQHVDVRLLAATNRDLQEEVRLGRFRADLYHRLSVYPLLIPPLRERRDDIPLLAGYFLDAARARLGLGPVRLTAAARAQLEAYHWPGNVREMEHLLLRATLRASAGRAPQEMEMVLIDVVHLGIDLQPVPAAAQLQAAVPAGVLVPVAEEFSLANAVDEFRRLAIQRVFAHCGGNWAETARRLGMDRGNLHRLARRLGLL